MRQLESLCLGQAVCQFDMGCLAPALCIVQPDCVPSMDYSSVLVHRAAEQVLVG